jgi:(p)ppGpp synthase/HD superfamily hydrolase
MAAVSGSRQRMAAVLHDVVEDTAITLDDLRARGFPRAVVAAVDALSRRPDEPYLDLVRRAARNALARPVKLADLRDNLDPQRLARFTPARRQRLVKKYTDALHVLGVRTARPRR